jgi:osmotically-inducible protein OsmY
MATVLAAVAASALLAGCAPLVLGGAVVGGGMVATDRRTAGTQLEDQSIELKAAARVRELATLGNVRVESYNRTVLLVGEVPGEREKSMVQQAVAQVENVRAVINELAVESSQELRGRASDTVLATKVRATLVDAPELQSQAFKVVVQRGNVYLMGRVTERESKRAIALVRTIDGVAKVVPVFETLSEDELARIVRVTPPAAQPAPAPGR